MAQKLETARDFKRIAKALSDPNARPQRWRVKDFGYCSGECREATEYRPCHRYRGDASWSDEIICCGCGGFFGLHSGRRGVYLDINDTESGDYFIDPEHLAVPAKAKKKIAELLSRETQLEYFFEALNNAMVKLEAERQMTAQRLVRIEREAKRLAVFEDFEISS